MLFLWFLAAFLFPIGAPPFFLPRSFSMKLETCFRAVLALIPTKKTRHQKQINSTQKQPLRQLFWLFFACLSKIRSFGNEARNYIVATKWLYLPLSHTPGSGSCKICNNHRWGKTAQHNEEITTYNDRPRRAAYSILRMQEERTE